MEKFKFIDLFSGIGGFHLAMKSLGGECVFAAEIDDDAVATYKENFGIDSKCDVTSIEKDQIPSFDVLCAGFPCQAFSKAGQQKGFSDTRGTLFFEIERILEHHLSTYGSPKFVFLENVRNLVSHDKGNTWETIKNRLKELGYILTEHPIIASPNDFGVPQLRERVIIIGIHKSIIKSDSITYKFERGIRNISFARDILESRCEDKYALSDYEDKILGVWDEFIKGVKETTIGFPIWIDAFQIEESKEYPIWKNEFIRRNKALYKNNNEFIDKWLEKNNYLNWAKPTDRKFEWQASNYIESLWEGIIQFRPSGIRVKRPTEFPALVAMVHIPIVGWLKRRITPREAARLQSFPESFIINRNDKIAYKQFGNSLNVKVVTEVISRVLATNALIGSFSKNIE